MKKKLFLIIIGIVLVGTVCIWLLTKNKPAGQMLADRLNEAVSHYTDMNMHCFTMKKQTSFIM